ncbi:uncharacterized protein PAC_05585 [Phialocephala subalpina]|uniref:Uncharacterized protein n=1 Tax=Phialocephala subalpina TaxID=576137 RepID=A0A1L7WSF9_9HELO|nr:uncharacterized protein PAC_05585 [Phialocephala subalpina]
MLFPSKSFMIDVTFWENYQKARIQQLSDHQVLCEIERIMNGRDYSWCTIAQRLRTKWRQQLLRLDHFEPGNVLYEWNVLCDEKVSWRRHCRPSFVSFKFNRDTLFKLRVIPSRAGLGIDGRKLATTNVDTRFSLSGLTVNDPEGRDGALEESLRGKNGYFYAEGPEFRIEYFHDRVEILGSSLSSALTPQLVFEAESRRGATADDLDLGYLERSEIRVGRPDELPIASRPSCVFCPKISSYCSIAALPASPINSSSRGSLIPYVFTTI